MSKVLYSTSAICNKIIDVLSDENDERIVITAFVGVGAEDYITKPQGLTLICWPKAGGTNPNTIRQLIKNGVKVKFCDTLHMKLYWSKNNGAVLTSANLTTNALGSGNLKEIGIYLTSDEIDIKKILNRLKTRKVTNKEMSLLDKAHEQFYSKNVIKEKSEVQTFKDWYKSPHRNKFDLGYCFGYVDVAKTAKDYSKNIYGKSNPYNCFSDKKGVHNEGDWVLLFRIKKNKPYEFEWFHVDFIIKIGRDDKKAYDPKYPYQYVQIWEPSRYERPPFKLDVQFKKVFGIVINSRKLNLRNKIELMSNPSRLLVDSLYKYNK